jgi:PleD family two-component response regulator
MEKLKAVSVDDSKTIIALIKKYLTELDIEVKTFLDPFEAIEYIKNNKIDFLFTDYVMPQMNGIELLNKLKPYFNGLTIMITSIGENDIKLKALEAGVTEFVNKPIMKAEFIATIANLEERVLLQKKLDKAIDILTKISEDKNAFNPRIIKIFLKSINNG